MLGSEGSSASGSTSRVGSSSPQIGLAQAARTVGLRRRDLVEELARGEGIRAIRRSERVILDLPNIGVSGAVLALQIEVFANRVVEYAHECAV